MGPLARRVVSAATAFAALATTVGIVLSARSHPPVPALNRLEVFDLRDYPPPTEGWVWADGQPGFSFGENEKAWNVSHVTPAELAPVQAVARRSGVEPGTVKVLYSVRFAPRDLSMIVAGRNADNETCLGFVTPSTRPAFYCPGKLGPQSAFVLVTTRVPYELDGQTSYPTVFIGIARGEVTRVVIDQPPDHVNIPVFDSESYGLWGTWVTSSPDARDVVLTVYDERGGATKVPIDLTEPGHRLVQIFPD